MGQTEQQTPARLPTAEDRAHPGFPLTTFENSESSYVWNSEMLGCNERDRDGDEVNWDQLDDLEMGLQTRIWGSGESLRSWEGFQESREDSPDGW